MAEEPAGRPGENARGRILVVDSAAATRALLCGEFRARGFDVAEALSGEAALELIGRETFDVILLDDQPSDLGGLEVLRRIRDWHSETELPVILITAGADSETIVEALGAGANDYITKPVDFAVAPLRVSTQVERRRAEEQVRVVSAALNRSNDDLEHRIAERTAELVRTNEQLRLAMAEAQAANKAKDEFLVIVSHELRTPLNGMVAMGQLLARSELNPAQQRMTGLINQSADQLHAVVADLLDALDLRSGRLALAPQPTELALLVEDAARAAADKASAKGLDFRLEIAPEAAVELDLDAERLRQVIVKLLDNAVKFTAEGSVVLSATPLDAAAGGVRLEVRDTGVGFDEAVAARLFHAFEQADSSMSRPFGGLGLGLAICRGLVELMGGVITAEGAPGKGARFIVDLPLPIRTARAA